MTGVQTCALPILEANPIYDRRIAQQMADLGAFVGAMTPEALGDFMGKIMNG